MSHLNTAPEASEIDIFEAEQYGKSWGRYGLVKLDGWECKRCKSTCLRVSTMHSDPDQPEFIKAVTCQVCGAHTTREE